jgi:hypothetical protein
VTTSHPIIPSAQITPSADFTRFLTPIHHDLRCLSGRDSSFRFFLKLLSESLNLYSSISPLYDLNVGTTPTEEGALMNGHISHSTFSFSEIKISYIFSAYIVFDSP